MKIVDCLRTTRLLLIAALIPLCGWETAQAQPNPQERVDQIREQLAEVQTKKDELSAEVRLLEEELKPENIERSLAGIGSTRPEDLRELRRRELEVERTALQNQLRLLAESKTRLETRLLDATTAAYQRSAAGEATKVVAGEQSVAPAQQRRERRARNRAKRRGTYRVNQD